MKSNLSNHGGVRKGQGRPSKWGEKTIHMRVPERLKDDVEAYIWRRIKQDQSSSSSK